MSEFVVEDVSFGLVAGTLEEVVRDHFWGDAVAMLTNWCLGMVDTEQVLVKGRMTSAKLHEDG